MKIRFGLLHPIRFVSPLSELSYLEQAHMVEDLKDLIKESGDMGSQSSMIDVLSLPKPVLDLIETNKSVSYEDIEKIRHDWSKSEDKPRMALFFATKEEAVKVQESFNRMDLTVSAEDRILTAMKLYADVKRSNKIGEPWVLRETGYCYEPGTNLNMATGTVTEELFLNKILELLEGRAALSNPFGGKLIIRDFEIVDEKPDDPATPAS